MVHYRAINVLKILYDDRFNLRDNLTGCIDAILSHSGKNNVTILMTIRKDLMR